jgi:hypothetical protein
VQQYLDLAEGEAEFLSLLDEPYGRHRVHCVGAILGITPWGLLQEAAAL